MVDKKSDLSVGEVSSRSGVAISAIHFYESKGLISSWRNAGNHRRYSRAILRKIAVIKAAQLAGIPLKEIGEALSSIPNSDKVTPEDWEKLSTQWRDDLNDRIERLSLLRDTLSYCIGCGCLSAKYCDMINTNDKFAKRGSGPRLLDPEDAAEIKKDWPKEWTENWDAEGYESGKEADKSKWCNDKADDE